MLVVLVALIKISSFAVSYCPFFVKVLFLTFSGLSGSASIKPIADPKHATKFN